MSQLITKKQIAIMKKEDPKLINIEIDKLRHEYAKSLYEEMKENGKHKKQ